MEERVLLDGVPVQFGSADAFKQYLVDTALAQYHSLFGQQFTSYYPYPLDLGVPAAFTATLTSTQAGNANVSFTQTNVQVQGVDEPDFVKTDGQFIYDLRDSELDIVQVGPGNAMQIASRTPIEGYGIAEYVIGNRVTIISNVYNFTVDPHHLPLSQDGFPLIANYLGSKTKVTVLDVSDRSNPQVAYAVYMDGYNLTSRAIGNEIYLVNQNYVTGLPAPAYTTFNGISIYETEDSYLARIAGHEIDLALPHLYTRPGGPGTPLQVAGLVSDPAQIYEPLTASSDDLLSVFSLDVSATSPRLSPATSILASYASTVYASASHFYVAMPFWAQDGSGANGTNLLQFALNGSQVNLTAVGTVTGQVFNQFWMDENGSYFRIVTTANYGANTTNNLFVMTAAGTNLTIVGSLEDFAHGEGIRAVRFLDTRAFIDTFQQIDPLFAIDLSNPSAPNAVGALQLTGFSSYLQPIDTNHLLGIGRDADGLGLTLQLFDISTLSNPREVDHYVINPPNWNWWWGAGSEAEWDHHAVGYFPEVHTLAIPIYGTYTGYNYSSFQSSLWVFDLHPSTGFSKICEITQDSQVRRSLQINDRLYAIAEDSIKAQPIQDPGGPSSELRLSDNPRFPIYTQANAIAGMAATIAVVNFVVTDPTGLQATIDWGDGGLSAGTIVPADDGRYVVMGTHTYASANQYYTNVTFTRGGADAGTLYGTVQVKVFSLQTMHFVQQLYRDLLHREAELAGLYYWSLLIDQFHATRTDVAQQIEASSEYHVREVQNLYTSLLGRAADLGGLSGWVGFLDNGGTIEQVKDAIFGSPEYYQHAGGTDVAFLSGLYHDILGRGVDSVGAATFGPMLANQVPRSAIAELVLTSPEAASKLVQNDYQNLLHRSADGYGLNLFTNMILQGSHEEDVLAMIAGSDEYLSHV
jgi:uncharacterized secreted protein with C-terminal beta-propeller domain